MNETISQVSNAIRSYINTNWDTGIASVTWENAPQTLEGDDPWIRVSVRHFQPRSDTIGTICIHRRGIISIQVFSRYDVGTGQVETVVDAIVSMLEFNKIGTIQLYAATPEHIGDSVRQLNHIESTWFQVSVKIPFETL